MYKKNYGLLIEPMKIRDYDIEIVCGSLQNNLPETYTLPEKWIPPIHDQGMTYKCVMFASAQCAEFELLKKNDNMIHFSPSFGYGRKECRQGYDKEGLYVSQAIKGLISIGFVDEKFFDFATIEVPQIIEIANQRDDLLSLSKQYKPCGFVSINYYNKTTRWNVIKDALAHKNSALLVVSNKYFGGSHAVMGIGYTEEKNGQKGQYIEIQNSWGADWNKNGRDFLPLSEADGVYMFVWNDIKLPFNDIKISDWFYDDVRAMYLSGIIKGITKDIFGPYDNIIRGDVAIILHRLLERVEYSLNCFIKTCIQEGKQVVTLSFNKKTDIQFNDIDNSDYYANSIYYNVANGILKGIDSNIFEPKKAITRAELATVIVRAYELIINKLTNSFNKILNIPMQKISMFSDVDKDSWYYDNVHKAAKYGFVNGDGMGVFRPNDFVTRAEASAITQRLFKSVEIILEKL